MRTTNDSTSTIPTPIPHDSVTRDLINTEKEPATSSALSDQDGSEGCECRRTFEEDVRIENGTEWAMCVCSRWIHIDCTAKLH